MLDKLRRSGASERHAFIFVPGLTPAPWPVPYLVMADPVPLPTIAPDLPWEVTHAWVASTWSTATGLRWSPDVGWRHFLKDGHSVRRLTRYRVSPVPGLILVELSFIAHRPPPSAPLALHPIRLVVPDDHQRLAIGDLLHEFGSSRVGGASRVQQHTADAVPLAGRRWSRLLP